MHKKVMISLVKLNLALYVYAFPLMDKAVSFQTQLFNGTCIREKHLQVQTGRILLIALIRLFEIRHSVYEFSKSSAKDKDFAVRLRL